MASINSNVCIGKVASELASVKKGLSGKEILHKKLAYLRKRKIYTYKVVFGQFVIIMLYVTFFLLYNLA